ncbi:MAG TPA: hypothetical protein VKE70_05270 [Candidatus Solibacter sp.]|nr:hypothetical protein [Candidatus Solibacter sp.]
MKRRILLTICALATAGIAGEPNAIDAKAAFSRLKSLAGEWKSAKDERLSIELIAGGTSLVERESAEDRPVMVTVYHLDGNRLLLTHYCMAGNQPRMQAREFDAATGRLRFDFIDATGLTSKDAGHMHTVTLRIPDKDHLSSEWTYFEGGKPKMTESGEYTRVR